MLGTCLKYYRAKGFGFVIPNDPDGSDHFVHYSEIQAISSRRFLKDGQPVEFDSVQDDQGRFRAVNVRKLDDVSTEARGEVSTEVARG
jgi:cold shock CspA family protein